MKPGDLILRNQRPAEVKHVIGSTLSALAIHGVMLSFLVLLLLSTVIAAADICRAASGNQRLFSSIDFLAQINSYSKVDAIEDKERSRLERSDLDAYRNETRRWHQLKAEMKMRASVRHSNKPVKSHTTL